MSITLYKGKKDTPIGHTLWIVPGKNTQFTRIGTLKDAVVSCAVDGDDKVIGISISLSNDYLKFFEGAEGIRVVDV